MQDVWDPPKTPRFNRDTAKVTFQTAPDPPSLMERARPMMLGSVTGLALGAAYWFGTLWFGA